ncbi:hypothetical protein [Alteromonas facilis]|uniref:hypothetical protein n=1 Tax=Alteromonas facilis TaxID=2048004 RepID=UPI000C28BF38|nr:hypothetical protein [Alteromonas facilis]
MAGVFKAHGELALEIHGNILKIEGTGPWNLELIKQAEAQLPSDFPACLGPHWGVITIMHGDPMYIPSAEAHLKNQISIEKNHGRVATAVVITNDEHFDFYARYFDKMYTECGDTVACFADQEKAEQWLNEQLAVS